MYLNLFLVEIEQFTDCFYVEFEKVHCARRAKTLVDRKNFYGGNRFLIIVIWKLIDFSLLVKFQ